MAIKYLLMVNLTTSISIFFHFNQKTKKTYELPYFFVTNLVIEQKKLLVVFY